MSNSPRLGLPFLEPGQAQKEYFHNEALQALDALVARTVETPPVDSPPPSPVAGSCYIVGSAATGAWAGMADHLAAFTPGGWRFFAPFEGLDVHVKSTGVRGAFRAGAWELGIVRAGAIAIGGEQVVGSRQAAIADPSAGTTVDSAARTAISSMLAALRAHGLIAP